MKFKREDITQSPESVRVIYFATRESSKEPFWDEIVSPDVVVIRADKNGVELTDFNWRFTDPREIADLHRVMQQAYWHHTCIRDGHGLMRSGEPDCVVEVVTDKQPIATNAANMNSEQRDVSGDSGGVR